MPFCVRCPGFQPFYVDGRWAFDLVLSNPDMVPLYRMPARQHMAYVGCAH